jgi:hypothetical protein
MFIQSSELTAAPGHSGELRAMIPEMRNALAGAMGTEWSAWTVATGRPFGTCLLSTRFDGYADMLDGLAKIAVSTEFATQSAGAAGILHQPAETNLAEVVAVTGEPGEAPPFLIVTRATMRGNDMAGTIGWSCDVMEHVTKVTGNGGMVATSAAGTMFQVVWITGADSPAELEEATQKTESDAGYLEMLSKAGADELFIPGASERMLLVRMP